MSSNHGGHRYGLAWGIPPQAQTKIGTPELIREKARQVVYDLWIEYLRENYGVDSPDDLSEEQQNEIMRLSNKVKQKGRKN